MRYHRYAYYPRRRYGSYFRYLVKAAMLASVCSVMLATLLMLKPTLNWHWPYAGACVAMALFTFRHWSGLSWLSFTAGISILAAIFIPHAASATLGFLTG